MGDMKNKNKEIDLVVPVYKATGTLENLLASVLVQTMKEKIHIILVQDFDGENYSEIISNFDKMLDIELIKMEKNSGPGTSRRIGTKKGVNKYVMYMDADDVFQNPFAVYELYNEIEVTQADAVNSIFLEQTGNDVFVRHENDWIWVFGKIYRRSFLEKNNIEMNDSRANEDTGFNNLIYSVGKVSYLQDITYIWKYKENSITRINNSIYRFTGIEGWAYNMSWAIEEMARLNIDKEKIQMKNAEVMMSCYLWYNEFLVDKDERINIELFLEWVRKYVANTYNKYIPTKKMLEDMYIMNGNNSRLLDYMPSVTFIQFIEMVGGKSAEQICC